MLKNEYDKIRNIAKAEFIPSIPLSESDAAFTDIYGFAMQFRPAPGGGKRNLGNDAYFKVFKLKRNTPIHETPIQVVRIYFTRPECVKHKPINQNWDLKGKDKKNINKYLETNIEKLDSKIDTRKYKGMSLYSFLILIADKLVLGVGPEVSIYDDQIIERSKQDPLFVGKDFISIYYPKPDYSKMYYIN